MVDTKQSRQKSLLINTIIIGIGTFLPKVSSFIVLPILTGMLTKVEYGTYDLVTVLASLLLPASTLQIQSAAFRFLIDSREKKDETDKIITNIFAFLLVSSILPTICLWFFLPTESQVIKFLMCCYLLSDIFAVTSRQIARGLDKSMDYSISSIIAAFGNLVLVYILVKFFKFGLNGALISLTVSTLISVIVVFYRIKLFSYFNIKLLDKNELKELLSYSWPMVPNALSLWVMSLSDRMVVTYFMGVAANAVYVVANKIPSILNLVQNAYTLAWQENASIASKDSDAESYYSEMYKFSYDFTASILLGIVCIMPLLFKILIRGEYSEAYVQMPILIVAMFFHSMAIFLGGIYIAFKRTKSVGITTVCAAISNFVIDVGLINFIGLYAASGSTLISYFLLFLFRLINVKKIINIKFDYKRMILILILMLIECVIFLQNNIIFDCLNIVIGVTSFCLLNKSILKKLIIAVKHKFQNLKN